MTYKWVKNMTCRSSSSVKITVPHWVVFYFWSTPSSLPHVLSSPHSLHLCVCRWSCGGMLCFRWATSRRAESQRLFTHSERRKGQKFTLADSLVSDIRPVWETHFSIESLAAAACTEHYSFITTYFYLPFISDYMLREELRGSFFFP